MEEKDRNELITKWEAEKALREWGIEEADREEILGDIPAEGTIEELNVLRARSAYLEQELAALRGENKGLRFALRCGGVSGAEVKDDED